MTTNQRLDRRVLRGANGIGAREVRSVRWECPICSTSRATVANGDGESDESARQRAEAALHSHVTASVGDGHGPQHSVPDGLDPDRLGQYVDPED